MPDEMRQEALSQNGAIVGSWVDFTSHLDNRISDDEDFHYHLVNWHGSPKYKIYPKSLHGIDDNNGWTIVSSETLPTEPGHYMALHKGGTSLPKLIVLRLGEGHNIKSISYIAEYCSHYRKLEEDKMPIY